MSIMIELPPELEQKLSTEASQLNLSLSDYILRILLSEEIAKNLPKTGAELVNYWQNEGVINSCPDITDMGVGAQKLLIIQRFEL
ncbi:MULTISPECIES: hypothetical protein [Planktothrix]|uniref:hypothetical protein n=1 Tax=Planktothrix TaxID=54304 RepID=UPI00047985A9|nr:MULTISPECIES: hypothetical protein [Planktothrix]CAD5925293.1 hypothetical protein NO758_00927 [Planktothrix agardhii]